jgi:hypothetical protein
MEGKGKDRVKAKRRVKGMERRNVQSADSKGEQKCKGDKGELRRRRTEKAEQRNRKGKKRRIQWEKK